MLTIKMPWKDLTLFIVLNHRNMYTGSDYDKYNVIILNGIEVDELIDRLSTDMEKSRPFLYWLCFINTIDAIDNMRKLINWMNDNGFRYHITYKQLQMYHETAVNS